ncbi:MAG: citrate lyase subunit alpha [Eubacteriales bacterium]|nr:citrate lyase subunit alpha [Eubacteriales bacterium]
MSKLYTDLGKLIAHLDIPNGSRISFHHHLRNGDYVLNAVMAELAKQGKRDLTINASAFFDCHEPLIELIEKGVVSGLECNYMSAKLGAAIGLGILEKPVIFRTHGGRPKAILDAVTPIDFAFIAAPTADYQGNLSGKYGPSACGSLGYAFPDARAAKTVIALSDNLIDEALADYSIPGCEVDYVVSLEQIGNPQGIVSGTTQVTRDPIGLLMAQLAVKTIQASGLLKDGFSFQTGAGGASLASAKYLHELMLEQGIKGSFGLGGITSYLVKMLEDGCFETLYDVQCFDLAAVESIRNNPQHREVSAMHYAAPSKQGALVDHLDLVILGATEIDRNFNVNVHTNSQGQIMGGSGGHSDTAAGAKLAMIIAPLIRARMPLILPEIQCVSTPGESIDCVVTQYGIAVNPARSELKARLEDAGLPLKSISELEQIATKISGRPQIQKASGRVIAEILYRDGSRLSEIRQKA